MRKWFYGLALLMSAPLANAIVIIDDNTGGLYNDGLGDLAAIDGPGGFLLGPNVSEGDPSLIPIPDPGLVFPASFGADWLNGDLTGGSWSASANIPDTWAVNAETAIIYEFTLDAISDLQIDLGVDNGLLLWLNGSYLFGAQASGGSALSEYDVDLVGVSAGLNRLQILREDHGGATGFDIRVDATRSVTAVPEPGTLGLLGFSLVAFGFGALRTRRR